MLITNTQNSPLLQCLIASGALNGVANAQPRVVSNVQQKHTETPYVAPRLFNDGLVTNQGDNAPLEMPPLFNDAHPVAPNPSVGPGVDEEPLEMPGMGF